MGSLATMLDGVRADLMQAGTYSHQPASYRPTPRVALYVLPACFFAYGCIAGKDSMYKWGAAAPIIFSFGRHFFEDYFQTVDALGLNFARRAAMISLLTTAISGLISVNSNSKAGYAAQLLLNMAIKTFVEQTDKSFFNTKSGYATEYFANILEAASKDLVVYLLTPYIGSNGARPLAALLGRAIGYYMLPPGSKSDPFMAGVCETLHVLLPAEVKCSQNPVIKGFFEGVINGTLHHMSQRIVCL